MVTDETPVVSYWSPTQILSDNRIPALGADTSTYTFRLPTDQTTCTIEASLIFRRVFYDVSAARGWDMPDILMETQTLTVSR